VLGVTAQVLFKHGYKSGLQLVVRKLTSFGVLQSYLRYTSGVIPIGSPLNVLWHLSRSFQRRSIGESKEVRRTAYQGFDKQNCGL